jgi:hypothetical protein
MDSSHLDALDLELLRSGEANGDAQRHLDECPPCRSAFDATRELARRLRSAAPPFPAIPDEVDARVRWQARLAARRARRSPIVSLPAAARLATAAAAVLALAALLNQSGHRAAPHLAAAPPIEFDVDGDRRVTILDAFALARQQRASADAQSPDPRIEAIARAAVRLRGDA